MAGGTRRVVARPRTRARVGRLRASTIGCTLPLHQSQRSQASSNLSKLGSTLTRTEQAITRLTVSYAEGVLGLEAYRSATKELERKRDGLMSTINSAESERRAIPVSLEVVQSLLDDWDIIGVEQRREMLRGLVRHVVVKPQRPRSEVTVVPIWEAGV